MKKRLLCFFLTAALILCLFAGTAPSAQAATRQEKTRAIAIVFDNSGSMYMQSRTRWCQAIYAMEVFAAMMNEGDQLLVYPMWPITLGTGGNKQGIHSYVDDIGLTQDVLTINGPGEASKIREIYTPNAGGTPFSTVTNAYKGLLEANADEKHLIVLTDGAFLDGSMPASEVSRNLDEYAKDVNVMFLGIEISDVYMPTVSNSSRQVYKKVTSAALLDTLTDMCNRIFGRDELDAKSNKITFDVSMGKIIIFVQGAGIENVTLSGGTKVSDHATKYSTYGSASYGYSKPDESLQGMLVTYKDLDAGSYTINYTGNAENISVYYEPDVDLSIQLVDEDGNPVDVSKGEISAGTYRIEYGLVDKYGVPTTSKLLGDQYFDLTYTANGTTDNVTDKKAGSFTLELQPDTTLEADFLVQYLKDYTIRKDNSALGWPPGGLNIVNREVGAVEIQVTGGSDSYVLSTLEQEAVYDITISHEGVQLSGEDLDKTTVNVELTGGNAQTQLERTDTGYRLYIRYNGDAPSTDCGEYTLNLSAAYTLDTTGQSNVVTRPFTLTDDSTALGLAIEVAQDFYQISKIPESSPIIAHLTMGGAPMDPATFNTTTLSVDIPGVNYEIQADAANSLYIITLKEGEIEPGKYTLTVTATGVDEIGRTVSVQDSVKLNLQNYPPWIPGLLTLLGALLILLLVWLYLNTKILPKHIGVGTCTFIVDGEIVTGAAKCSYSGKNKRRGTLTVQSPHYGANPAAKCGYTLDLEAVSPRRTRSSARSVHVVNVRPLSPTTTIAVQVGGCNLSKDPVSGKLMRAGARPGAPLSFNIGNNAGTSVTAEVMDMASGGGEITVSMSVPLRFH